MDISGSTVYSYTVCIKCETAEPKYVQEDGWVIAAIISCSALTAPTPTTVALAYTSGAADAAALPTTAAWTSWDTYFGNTESGCGFTSCMLRDAGDCGGTTFAG